MRKATQVVGAAIVGLAASGTAAADGIDVFKYAVSGGTPNLDLRLRYENVDQNNALKNARACTARARLGYTTGKWNALDAALEFEGVSTVGEPQYNSRRNGQAAYSVIADPAGNELNQAWIRYAGVPGTVIKYGRQRIVFDNARFIGNAGWRQNEQTFDAALLTSTWLPKTTINYAFVTDVNSVVLSDYRLHAHLLNVAVKPIDALAITAYGYLLDFNPAAATVPGPLSAAQAADQQTLGLRFTGTVPMGAARLGSTLEYAKQDEYADSTIAGSDYLLGEVSATLAGFTLKGAYEKLGGNGTRSFQTPLATLHAFQGWADLFLTTPAGGIVESSLTASYAGAAFGALLRGSQFRGDVSATPDYGFEVDGQVTYAINDQTSLGVKVAQYDAHTVAIAPDTKKAWAWIEYKF